MKKVILVLFTLLLVLPLMNVMAANTEIDTVIGDDLEKTQIDDNTKVNDSSNTEPEKTEIIDPVEDSETDASPTNVLITNEIMPSNIDVNDIVPPDDVTFIIGKSIFETDKPYLLELNFDYPADEDFSHYRIYRNGQLLEEKYKLFTFMDDDVLPNTEYIYKIITVDVNNNHSLGFIESITTDFIDDLIPPSEPTGLSLSVGNQSGRITWDRNVETDLASYNVYLNGALHDSVLTNNYMVSGLDNSSLYTVTVTAVDTSGNESPLSTNLLLSPKQKSMPVLQSNHNSQELADGVNFTFSKFFPLIAFVTGVPLAFYVGSRIKTLILA